MKTNKKKEQTYNGFEQGPIRPPSEAGSYLVRVTRNCPWNRCTFCPVYKGARFSVRPVEHVIRDIDAVHRSVQRLQLAMGEQGLNQEHVDTVFEGIGPQDVQAFRTAVQWIMEGMESIFLQDANSLVVEADQLVQILSHLKNCFPGVRRITSYARAHTVARIKDKDLEAISRAGLNRIHIGLESGCDRVLEKVSKGVTSALHIDAGLKVKAAGMELSEYVMPGLGGVELSEAHALETAETLNCIDPHFIRLRTLALPSNLDLFREMEAGTFQKNPEIMTVKEILLMIRHLDGITSTLKSDHVLNLFQELEGRFPHDKEYMTGILDRFLAMEPMEQCHFQVGRRLGVYQNMEEMNSPPKRAKVESICKQLEVSPETVDGIITDLMKRFV